jgi:hypothetical protein
MSYYFQTECRRWAQSCDVAGVSGLSLWFLDGRLIDGMDLVYGLL